MLTIALYTIGLLCRLLVLGLAMRIAIRRPSWKLNVMVLACAWIVVEPLIKYFFSAHYTFIPDVQPAETYFIDSIITVTVFFFLSQLLEENSLLAQESHSHTEEYSRRQNIILQLAKRPTTSITADISALAAASAEELNVSRVGVWLYNHMKDGMDSLVLYDAGDLITEPIHLTKEAFPAYFDALDRGGMVIANDARSNPITIELADDYLTAYNIYSMLDVPIRIDGQLVGIICHEHIDNLRTWSTEDQDFAHSLADLCALSIAEDRRRKIERKLQDSDRLLSDAQNIGQFGSFRWNLTTNKAVWSGKVMTQVGWIAGTDPVFSDDILPNMIPRDAEKFTATLDAALADHQPFRVRVQSIPSRGSRYYEVRGEHLPGGPGEEGFFEGTVQDITEQTLIELENRSLEGQLIQSQKMESIGTMAGGIAHDFNNILTPILGYTDVALSEVGENSPAKLPLQEILNSSLRAKELVEQILLFSRRFEERQEPVDLQKTISTALRLMRSTLPVNVTVDFDAEPDCPLIAADSTQMVQIVVNLCTNAWHAMQPNGGHLRITLKPKQRDGLSMTELCVHDTGTGIEPESLNRIFEPFYTTKDVGEGTGLGLSMVHGIVSKLDGYIEVESEPGSGTQFSVYLPATDELPQVTEPQPKIEKASSKSASILVVDDDAAVAGILKSMLIDLGFEADVHLSTETALLSFKENPNRYDMLVTDLTMPDMSGVELSKKMREIMPDLPIVIVSGYSEDMVREETKGLGDCHIVGKPLLRADLATVIGKELH